jgi:hypothetical protein
MFNKEPNLSLSFSNIFDSSLFSVDVFFSSTNFFTVLLSKVAVNAPTLAIYALEEDITDVREMYRTQLNVLLEEKAAGAADVSKSNDERQELSNETSGLKTAGAVDVSHENDEKQEPSNGTSESTATGAGDVSIICSMPCL